MMATQIPDRDSSKYAGQYARTLDFQRLIQILTDSHKIALSSKNPETARDRFALAVEAYHQLTSIAPPADVLSSVRQSMKELVESFPVQVALNEALGLREKARKLKTPRKKLDLLRRAREIVDRGLNEHPSNSPLQAATVEVQTELSQLETEVKG